MKHVPNALTVARIVITPAFLVLLLSGTFWGQLAALVLFVLGAISDWADGEVARRYGVRSRLGQFLDPLADKVLVLGGFFALPLLPPDPLGRTLWALALWWVGAGLIAFRDVAVTGLRAWAERRGRPVQTQYAAKVKTAVQLTFLILIQVLLVAAKSDRVTAAAEGFAAAVSSVLYGPVPFVLLLITVVLTLWTGALYFRQRRPSPHL
ncbi:MAG: CDP-alcohol phosphatidyltransferase family protein [Rhodothermales bacterium]|nr:CDP-alcohol phosphatidyltransferase family protein [Rhodothermales bacterium]